MPAQPRTVLDGLEGAWEAAQAKWRETNRRREAAEAAAARGRREAARRITNGVETVVGRAGQVADAVFGDRTTDRPQVGPVDVREVDRRIHITESDIGRGVHAAQASGYPEAASGALLAAGGRWLNRVREGGAWDDKSQHPGARLDQYERQGNYSYGATAAALGLPEEIALRGAGLVQRVGAVTDALNGRPIRERAGGFRAPYGDDPRDQRSIKEGYAYGRTAIRSGRQ